MRHAPTAEDRLGCYWFCGSSNALIFSAGTGVGRESNAVSEFDPAWALSVPKHVRFQEIRDGNPPSDVQDSPDRLGRAAVVSSRQAMFPEGARGECMNPRRGYVFARLRVQRGPSEYDKSLRNTEVVYVWEMTS